MKTSNAEEIRLKGVEIGFFTPFFVLEAQWWNIHTQFNSDRGARQREKFDRQGHGRHPSRHVAGRERHHFQGLFRGGTVAGTAGAPAAAAFPGTAHLGLQGRHAGRGQRREHPSRGGFPGDERRALSGRILRGAEIDAGIAPGTVGRPGGEHFPAQGED